MAVTLYNKQKQIYDFLCQYIQKNDFAPTLREIADAMGVSSAATIHEHLSALEYKGLIKRSKGKNRSLELVNRTMVKLTEGVDLPISGFIGAGAAIETNNSNTQTYKVSPEIITGKRRAFILEVKDDSLSKEFLLQGDRLVLEEDKEINSGDIIVGTLDNGVAVFKKHYREATRIRLEPVYDKDTMPIYAGKVKIQGRVVGMIRKID
ncbi:MAG: transcriptional repressor LexA [Pseudomonadales bacterium]|nr:transcriptional repressor LexA [Pseudomonadales bacterium]